MRTGLLERVLPEGLRLLAEEAGRGRRGHAHAALPDSHRESRVEDTGARGNDAAARGRGAPKLLPVALIDFMEPSGERFAPAESENGVRLSLVHPLFHTKLDGH